MSDNRTMAEIREIRERISTELAPLSEKDFLDYFHRRRTNWASKGQIEAMARLEAPHPPVTPADKITACE